MPSVVSEDPEAKTKPLKQGESHLDQEKNTSKVKMVEEESGSLELEEAKVDMSSERPEKPAAKKWVARPLTTVRI